MQLIQRAYLEYMRYWLGLDEKGELWTAMVPFPANTDWKPVSFNEQYRDYYVSCIFTNIFATEKEFVAAGQGQDGLPYVYKSLMGSVWENAGLFCKTIEGYVRASSDIITILYDQKNRQIFFPCRNGDLITMPNCPKCMKLTRVCRDKVKTVKWKDKLCTQMILTTESGKEQIVQTNSISQFRIIFSYAKEILKEKGYLVDLRENKGKWESEIEEEKQIHLNFNKLSNWLATIPKDTFIFFQCENGTRAELAAYMARNKGYHDAYSIDKET